MGLKTIRFGFLVEFIVIFSVIFAPVAPIQAFDCLTLTPASSEQDKELCKKELANIEAQLAELLKKQEAQKKQTGTLQGDVNYLTSQINALKTKIKARGLAIAQIKTSITEKVSRIRTLSQRIEEEHEDIANLLRNINDYDNRNLVHVALADQTLSDFYSDVESYNTIQVAVKASIDEIKGIKTETEEQKKQLEEKQDAELDAKAELENAQKKVAQSEAEKKNLLSLSKQKETEYQKQAALKQAQAAKIRSALFPLAGTSQKIEFGTALAYAKEAQAKTGIEPAFLLAILTQESNLGANVGQCYLKNQATGAGVGKNTGTPFANVMKPMGLPGRKGDVEDFLAITSKLGLQWDVTAVSCPIPSAGGYGGAMGPAQFIPTTWKLFETRLTNALGHFPSPWTPKDAFFASAMYLTDLGAYGTSYAGQIKAACSYYGTRGATCGYGTSVMNFKAKIQADIDYLEQYGVAR